MRRSSHYLILCLLLLASAASQADFRFVAWADNRSGTIDTVPSTGTNRARFQWMLTEMNRLIVQPSGSMVPMWHIVPGDFDETETTEADLYLSGVLPWAFAPGNHDLTELWRPNTSWDHENAHFVFLNEYCCGDGRICDHVYDWLVDDLNSNTQPAIFVVGHEPAFPENAHVGDSLDADPEERDRFWQLLRDHGVVAYICGHTHWFSTETVDGVLQIDVGNAGNPAHGEPHQTFVVFDVTPDYVYVDVYSGNENQPYGWTDDLFVLPIPEPVFEAHAPSPSNGAVDVQVDTVLSWVSGTGAVSHDVYLGTNELALEFIGNQVSTQFAPTLDFGISYFWRIDERYTDGTVVPGQQWTFTTSPATIEVKATGETPVDGDVSGSYLDTHASDGDSEAITEVLNVPNKNGYSTLEHIWTFDVPTGSFIEFHIEAYRSTSTDGDDFDLSYSTDGYTYAPMLMVTETYSTAQSFILPPDTTGPVYIKATDTDHTKKNQDFDTLFVDCMWIVSSQIPIVDYKASNPSPADGATGVLTNMTLSWEAGDEATGHDVYLGVDPLSLTQVSDNQIETSYTPSDLAEGTVYYWRIDEERAGDIETGAIWSFTTYADPGTPTTMSAAVAISTVRLNPPNEKGCAVVTVTDNLGDPVYNAIVTGHFTGDFSDACEGITDQNGQVEFITESDMKKPSFGFEVNSVVYPGLKWLQ